MAEPTSLVLKRIPFRCTSVILLEMLDKIAEGQYDFVHLPYHVRNHRHLSLAFVNFLDHWTATAAFMWLSTPANCPQGLARGTQVHWGQIHGLGPNLAHIVARFGIGSLDPPYAPFVFLRGICIARPRDILARFVTPSLLQAAREQVQRTPGEGLEEAANSEEFWRRPQQLSDLRTLPWDRLRRCVLHLESDYAIFRL
eukprot:Skav206732  [mRNA]  locus=scaffold2729:45452:46045:+ [translate_table: standard]